MPRLQRWHMHSEHRATMAMTLSAGQAHVNAGAQVTLHADAGLRGSAGATAAELAHASKAQGDHGSDALSRPSSRQCRAQMTLHADASLRGSAGCGPGAVLHLWQQLHGSQCLARS